MKRLLITLGLCLVGAPAMAGGLDGAAAFGNTLQYEQNYRGQAQQQAFCTQAMQYAMKGGPQPPAACFAQSYQPSYVPIPTQPLQQPKMQTNCRWLGSTWTCY